MSKKQFTLDSWLKDKSQKVVTRCGFPVRIVCTDVKRKDYPILALVERDDQEEYQSFTKDGRFSLYNPLHDNFDLFIETADEVSEGEKVRKEIVRFIRMEVEDEIVGNKWLAWLGKQAERKTPQWMIDFLDNYRRKIGCSLDHDEARDVEGKILCIMQWLENQGQVKESTISQHEIETCKENNNSLTCEDEKVRKALLEMVHDTIGDELLVDYNVHKEEALAWLERQGEHANFLSKIQVGDKVTRNENGVLVNLSQLKRVAKPREKQGETFPVLSNSSNIGKDEQKPLGYVHHIDEDGYYTKEAILEPNPYTGTGFNYNGHHWGMCARDGGVEILMDGNITSRVFPDKNNIIEQKPADSYCQENCKGFQETGKCFADGECKAKREAEQKSAWSEEDGMILSLIVNNLKFIRDTLSHDDKYTVDVGSFEGQIEWLQSLKDRVQPQPKQEWSEEDEQHIDSLLKRLDALCRNKFERTRFAISEDRDWLKSLRPQNKCAYNPYKADNGIYFTFVFTWWRFHWYWCRGLKKGE